MDWGKRAMDQGKEDPYVILAELKGAINTLDATVKTKFDALNEKLDGHIHTSKGNSMALNSRIDLEVSHLEKVDAKLEVEDEAIKKKLDWAVVRICYGMGGLSVVTVIAQWLFAKH